jgi:predicted nucleic acid-binding protein
MPKPRVYVETTIPSAYYTGRTDPEMVARHIATREWWHAASVSCELVTSLAVRQELADGTSAHVAPRLTLLEGLRMLDIEAHIVETAAVYISRKLMPAKPLGDALHVALASHHKCDVLITWNYRHLANRTKLERIKRLNEERGLFVPTILTPFDMLRGEG